MQLTRLAALLPFVLLATDAAASLLPAHHSRLARRANRKKRCLARQQNVGILTVSSSSSSAIAAPSEAPAPAPAPAPEPAPAPAPPPPPPPPAPPAHVGGTINVGSQCGDIGATPNPTTLSGPNGSLRWLNCGIEEGGWRPPNFGLGDVIAADLGEVLNRPGNPFSGCGEYLSLFYQYGAETGIPPILLASIAMQESSCRRDVTGGGGEVGLMQITHEKCAGAPGGNCYEPWFNIRTGAYYLKSVIDQFGGNLPQAVGAYNGWHSGMDMNSATGARYTSCCRCQKNLDYLHQLFNGWMQGVFPNSLGMGLYFNLSVCG